MSDSWVYRRTERLRITYFARCKAHAGEDQDVVIINVTPEGCCMALNGQVMQIGQHVLIRLETDDSLSGTVRWVRDGQVGVQFDEALDRKRVDYLRREHSTFLSEVEWSDEPVQRSVM